MVTKRGYMGLCLSSSRRGDSIVVLYGGSVPYILRRCGHASEQEDDTFKVPSSIQFEFIGECYVHGMMRGEAIDLAEAGVFEEKAFELRSHGCFDHV